MNASQSPSLSAPRYRWDIWSDYYEAGRRAYQRGDIAEGDRLRALADRTQYQIRLTRIANRYPRR